MRGWLIGIPFVFLLHSSQAQAVTQPDGTVIPVGDSAQQLFDRRGERINARDDAAIMPERFVPGCRLTFTLVTRGPAQFRNSFGWYNAGTSAPAESDLHVLIPCDAPDGFVATLDLSRETAYRGGEIGFFLRTPQMMGGTGCSNGDCCARVGHPGYTYYTERRYNPDNRGSGSYIHLLVYDSRSTAQSFYFAWEDLFAGGDNQFTDFVAQVGNIVCSGAGEACNAGGQGVCALGTRQCRNGMLSCLPSVTSSPERCDGLDNDCNGMTDEGNNLCQAGYVCDRGTCVQRCVEGDCFVGFACSPRGTCVERGCERMECPAGQTCRAGACVDACSDVRCPTGQACRAGRCVDPCAEMRCDTDQVCADGVCIPRCQCRACASGLRCLSTGRCVPTACPEGGCPAGQACTAMGCRDACEGAVCPRGERCTNGACVAEPRDAGIGAELGAVDAAPRVEPRDAGMDASMDGGWSPMVRRDCGCAVPGATNRVSMRWMFVAVGLLALRSARRRKREQATSSF